MLVGSLFTGIGGFDLGFERAGMATAWQCEIDKHCNRVLGRQWPAVQAFTDVKTLNGRDTAAVDVIAGGFPCQDLSVAGKRAGLAGERSGLFFEFMRIVNELHPRWVIIENVPGLLSSNRGRDMGTVLGTLGQLGYWWAYRVLDAQYYGVAQRRKRVFIVGHLGNGAYPAQVLFEPESVLRDNPPSRSARQEVAGTLGGGSGERGWSSDTNRMTFLPAVTTALLASADNGYDMDGTGRGTPIIPFRKATRPHSATEAERWEQDEVTNTLNGWEERHDPPAHLVAQSVSLRGREGGATAELSGEQATALRASQGGGDKPYVLAPDAVSQLNAVRRLTPTECERLQGFPDGWTAGEADSARYRMLGNAVCVNVAEWIGRRIMEVEKSQA